MGGILHKGFETAKYGSAYGGWTLLPELLSTHSVIYSVGIGFDISFDREVLALHGCTVHAFDPTPEVHQWLLEEGVPNGMLVSNIGIGTSDARLRLFRPRRAKHISHSLSCDEGRGYIEVECQKVSSVMRARGHRHLDILKLDVEGTEFEIVEDVLRDKVSIDQLLVEHHEWRWRKFKGRTMAMVDQLVGAGFVLYSVDGDNLSFVRTEAMERLCG